MQPVFIQRHHDVSSMVMPNGAILGVGAKPPRGTRLPYDVLVAHR